MAQEIREFRISNDAIDEPAELQRRIADEGYLFFRRMQDPDKMWELRRLMMTRIQEAGWLLPDTDPVDGIADVSKQCTEGHQAYTAGYGHVYKLEAFHRAAHWPEVTTMIDKIMGRPSMPHPQQIARIWFPQYTEHTTPIHQDFVHFQGNFETLTSWAPIGDCPIELGGLAVIPGSQKVGRVLDHHFSLGAGGLSVNVEGAEEFDPTWYSTDYEAGDTLIFPALTIHGALPNETDDKLRLSLDNRYLAVGDLIADHMLDPHGPSGLNWEQVYEDWESDQYKYYWKDVDNPVVAFDSTYRDRGFAEALELARAGHEQALYRLRRTISSDPDSEYAQSAREVLAEIGAPA
ncbi:MAG: phytanoyl-CoA dioxygenase family protein [Caldilineaceae bacterium]|nr:phytanoyl-CoA dioxygenase family protein [Caldilineaceae bacterium]